MKAISIVMHSALAAALLGFAGAAYAADDFIDACIQSAPSGGDMAKTCACMSTKIPADVRADAAEALRRSAKAMADTRPHEILHRPKQGFGTPMVEWLRPL